MTGREHILPLVPRPPAPHVGDGVFDEPASPDVNLVTDPPARSGDVLNIDATWNPASWDSLSSAAARVKVFGTLNPSLSRVDEPGPGAGAANHRFTIDNSYFAGTVICTRYRLAGDPAGPETQAARVSKQSCVEVHPEEDEQNHTTPTTTAPSATPPTTIAPVPTSPTEMLTQTTIDNTPQVPVVKTPAPTVRGEETSPPTGPIALPELPRTGVAGPHLALFGSGTAAVAGLAALAAARTFSRRRPTTT